MAHTKFHLGYFTKFGQTSWPCARDAFGMQWVDGSYHIELAKQLEAAKFDFVLFEDTVMVADAGNVAVAVADAGTVAVALGRALAVGVPDAVPVAVALTVALAGGVAVADGRALAVAVAGADGSKTTSNCGRFDVVTAWRL